MRANAISDSERIAIGDELILPGARPLARAPAAAQTAENAPVELAPAARIASSRVELAAAVVLPPSLGTYPSFVWPSSGPITTYFGEVGWTAPRGHAGLDIAAPWGAPVRAAAGGQVIVATHAGGPYGVQVILDHGSGLRTVYGHLSALHVAPGERVERGELIGLVGNTGFSTGPHLHFELRQNGELRDPLRFLP
jgi:murein DD-endopeptidase MepM/ murein hydrolase activator NlpD